MHSLSKLEQRIFEVDGVRASLSGAAAPAQEYWVNRFNGDNKVAEFRERFEKRYPGVSIVLYDGLGRIAHGNYLMKNLRATYDFDWVKKAHAETVEVLLDLLDVDDDHAPAPSQADAEPDPYAVLGVARDASDEDIRAAHRTRISRCHTDRISFMDDAIIKFATERAQLVNWARDEIARLRAGDA